MISVGVRQLKNGLTRYLRLVDQGEALLVTNRNRSVAVLKKLHRNSALAPWKRNSPPWWRRESYCRLVSRDLSSRLSRYA